MKIDCGVTQHLPTTRAQASAGEAAGFDGVWMGESRHDIFIQLAAAAEATHRVDVMSAVTVAFSRSPMVLAYAANDVQLLSEGRLLLGLGTQTKPHIERRFGMPWSDPAARLRDYLEALQAIWRTWNDRVPLDHRGTYYQADLMTPVFAPDPNPFGPPKVLVSAVGPRVTEVAATVADGLITHPFSTTRHFEEVTIPTVEKGLAASGRTRDSFTLACQVLAVSGSTPAATEASRQAVRTSIAFYGSTPAYRAVLDLHGWGDLHSDLHCLSREDRWSEMPDLIDDTVLEAFALVAEPQDLGKAVRLRFGDRADRVTVADTVRDISNEAWRAVVEQVHA